VRRHIEGLDGILEVCKIWVGGDGIEDGDNVGVPDIVSSFSREGSYVIVSFHRGSLMIQETQNNINERSQQ
jgi:hypothetical protein